MLHRGHGLQLQSRFVRTRFHPAELELPLGSESTTHERKLQIQSEPLKKKVQKLGARASIHLTGLFQKAFGIVEPALSCRLSCLTQREIHARRLDIRLVEIGEPRAHQE
jgi:hypothetical protein